MKKLWQFSIGILPLFLLASCGGAPEEPDSTLVSPPPSSKTGEEAPPVALSNAQMQSAGLIPSTDPKGRLKVIKKSRNNPFELMPVPILSNVVNSGDSSGVDGQGSPPGSTVKAPGTKDSTGQTSSTLQRVGKYCKWDGKTGVGILEIQPEEAKGVFVSGIVQFPGTIYAIVTPRNSQVSQNVRPGTVFGSGVVKVASIDPINQTVVLEENGRFVYREVGQRPEKAQTKGTALSEENSPIKVSPPTGPSVFGFVRKGNKTLMLTQASVLLVNVAGDQKSWTQQQLADPPWGRNPQNPPAESPTSGPMGPSAPVNPGPAQGSNPPTASNPPSVSNQPSVTQPSTRLTGSICNDSDTRLSVAKIKVQIQDAVTNRVIDSAWNDVASTNVVLERGQKADFDFAIPRLQNRGSGTITVKLIDWQG